MRRNGVISGVEIEDRDLKTRFRGTGFRQQDLARCELNGPVLIVVGIKKEKEKNSQKGKKKREGKGFC